LGGGGDRGHVFPQPAGQDLDREARHLASGADRDGRLPAALAGCGGPSVGQFAGEVGQHGWVGVGVGQAYAEVDDPPPAGRLNYQLGVVAGIGHRRHGLNQGVQERAAPDVGQLAGLLQLSQHSYGVGRLAAVGQAQDRPPDGPMGWPIQVGLLEQRGDLGQQPPGGQDRPQHRLLSFQVVRWLPVGLGHRAQAAPGRPLRPGHRRGLRGPLPRRRDLGAGLRWSRICLT
jgi:hypothetical protein